LCCEAVLTSAAEDAAEWGEQEIKHVVAKSKHGHKAGEYKQQCEQFKNGIFVTGPQEACERAKGTKVVGELIIVLQPKYSERHHDEAQEKACYRHAPNIGHYGAISKFP